MLLCGFGIIYLLMVWWCFAGVRGLVFAVMWILAYWLEYGFSAV